MVKRQSSRSRKKKSLLKRLLLGTVLLMGLAGLGVGVGLYLGYQKLSAELPNIDGLQDVQFEEPIRIYSADGQLISEMGEKRRVPLDYEQIPPQLIDAFVSVEDDRFFEHPGVDYHGLLRASLYWLKTGTRGQGGSTITMQLARNLYLTPKKTIRRKLSEILLALKIEQSLTKEEIITLYLNKIFLGHRSYGVGAAAQVYYGQDVADLTLAQMAMIAGLPKAPSSMNPVSNPSRAKTRRNHVLDRMFELGKISQTDYLQAKESRLSAKLHATPIALDAGYIAEVARRFAVERFGKSAYRTGLKVYTTLDGRLQKAATSSVRKNLLDYEQRHGFTGPVETLELSLLEDAKKLKEVLKSLPDHGDLLPAVVTEVNNGAIMVFTAKGEIHEVPFIALQWAGRRDKNREVGSAPRQPSDVVAVGDVIHLKATDGVFRLAQMPQVEAALVTLNPNNGAVTALVGGFDFFRSNFNRALQGRRQAGSTIKPLVYSAALEQGDTAATIYNDAPVVFHDANLESEWRPENYGGRIYGPTRLRQALIKSRNLVSIRVMQAVGVNNTINHLTQFGLPREHLPRDLSLSLGSASLTPLEMARAYAVFANGGRLVDPYMVDRIEDSRGRIIYQTERKVICPQGNCSRLQSWESPAPQVLDARNAYIMRSMMQDVIKEGTGRKALELGRSDLAGKTGTSNNQVDAWFAGYNADIVTTVWMGYDDNTPLGAKETGSGAALPLWVDYMATALQGLEERSVPQPEGLMMARIDKSTGALASAGSGNAMFEIFRQEQVPTLAQTQRLGGYNAAFGTGSEGTTTSTGSSASSSAGSNALDSLF